MDNSKQQEIINELLKIYVDGYFVSKGLPDTTTQLGMAKAQNEKGKLHKIHVLALKTIIEEELKIFGIDLATLLTTKGISADINEFNELEKKYIENKVGILLSFVNQYEKVKSEKN